MGLKRHPCNNKTCTKNIINNVLTTPLFFISCYVIDDHNNFQNAIELSIRMRSTLLILR